MIVEQYVGTLLSLLFVPEIPV